MRRAVFSIGTLALALAMGAAPACFPNFNVTTGSDGGSSGSGGGSGGSSGGGSGSSSGGGSGSSSGSGSGGGSGSSSGSGSGGGSGSSSGSGSGGASGDGGSAPYDAATQVLVPHGSFVFNDISGAGMTTATLTNDTLFDKTEVTTAAFDAWISDGMPVPADNQSLDPGGPYAAVMYWQGGDTWSNYAALQEYKDSTNCTEAQAISDNDNPPNEYFYAPTYVAYEANKTATTGAYPINCVNFYQAVAYCWWDGQKRLPTEAEWQYEITGRGRSYTYPWGNGPDPTDCSLAIWRGDGGVNDNYNGCGFPLPVGSAPKGASFDGVLDMQGSVEEWIWNSENNEFPTAWPPNYAGPDEDGGVDLSRTARSASFFTANDLTPKNLDGRWYDAFGTPSTTTYADLGFRCVKSRL